VSHRPRPEAVTCGSPWRSVGRMGCRGLRAVDPEQFRRLPEPVDLDATITSQDTVQVPPEKLEELQENEWLLRSSSAG
jgi:hypothetical protein